MTPRSRLLHDLRVEIVAPLIAAVLAAGLIVLGATAIYRLALPVVAAMR